MTTAADAPHAASKPEGRSITTPLLDFLLLGGASLILVPLSFSVPETAIPGLALFSALVSNFINHPHFAASYQIFYRNFGQSAFGTVLPVELRRRYIIAGLVVPVVIVGFMAACFLTGSARALGLSANFMAFLVGWHYNKQGYGMLMVDAAYKRRYFNDHEKKVLLANAYACWMVFYLGGNWYASRDEFWGLEYYVIPVPLPLLILSAAVASITTLWALALLVRRHLAAAPGLPVVGAVTYLITLYYWAVMILNPIALFLVPAFHSLQYLYIVWRFETNRASQSGAPEVTTRAWPVARFLLIAIAIGFTGFWALPLFLDRTMIYDTETFGASVFMFMFWIFINVHHYFIDNVIWRRENPDTARFLFGAKPKPAA